MIHPLVFSSMVAILSLSPSTHRKSSWVNFLYVKGLEKSTSQNFLGFIWFLISLRFLINVSHFDIFDMLDYLLNEFPINKLGTGIYLVILLTWDLISMSYSWLYIITWLTKRIKASTGEKKNHVLSFSENETPRLAFFCVETEIQ